MTRFDHSVSVGDGRRYVKVFFPVEREPGVTSESMWTEVLPDGSYQLKNIPAWVSGLSLDDVVVARAREEQLWFKAVRRRGGHSTFRIAFQNPERQRRPQPDFEALLAMRCHNAGDSPRLLALDVPAETSVDEVHRLLAEGMLRGQWWFDEMHFGHPPSDRRSTPQL
jgi:hypothetical protein